MQQRSSTPCPSSLYLSAARGSEAGTWPNIWEKLEMLLRGREGERGGNVGIPCWKLPGQSLGQLCMVQRLECEFLRLVGDENPRGEGCEPQHLVQLR